MRNEVLADFKLGYMVFGGTNWGNLGHAGGYTSYDYGAPITEGRELYREKYSELKLQGNFLKVSPAYLTATVGNLTTTTYTDNAGIAVTPLFGNGSNTNFYVVRHSDYQTLDSASYKMTLGTSLGTFTIPQLGGTLTLSGRDSKWAVTDYDLGGTNLVYSTAEIFTWKKIGSKTFLIAYGGPNELHELAIAASSSPIIIEGSDVSTNSSDGVDVLNWKVSSTRQVVQIDSTFIYLVDRNSAYNFWTADFSRTDAWGNYTANVGNTTSVIIQAGYLIRNIYEEGTGLYIEGDLNATVPFSVIGAPSSSDTLVFNDQEVSFTTDATTGEWTSNLEYVAPSFSLPDLTSLAWKYLNNLPEIGSSYDDSAWTLANNTTSNNPMALLTPTSLYASDYGYHTGALIYRGRFTAGGNESKIYLSTMGGSGFGSSAWLNGTFLGSWKGADYALGHNDTYTLPNLLAGQTYVLTVVVDNNGLQENWVVGPDEMKTPRGLVDFNLIGRSKSDVVWKITGNLGGENYLDQVRGPLNEGGLYAERQGFHQPNPPNKDWSVGNPQTGINSSGIAYYQSSFDLNIPGGYDIPLFFNFANTTINGATSNYQAQLYVNGWQFGKYINNVGPQTSFPVPQGELLHSLKWLLG